MRDVKGFSEAGFSGGHRFFWFGAFDDLGFDLSRYLNIGFDFLIHLIQWIDHQSPWEEIKSKKKKKKVYLIEHILEQRDMAENCSRVLHSLSNFQLRIFTLSRLNSSIIFLSSAAHHPKARICSHLPIFSYKFVKSLFYPLFL